MVEPSDKTGHLRDWLLYTGRYIEGFENFSRELTTTLITFGFDLCRLNLGVYILHPDIAGVAFQWHSDPRSILTIPVEHKDLQTPAYLQSPIRASVDEERVIRIRNQCSS